MNSSICSIPPTLTVPHGRATIPYTELSRFLILIPNEAAPLAPAHVSCCYHARRTAGAHSPDLARVVGPSPVAHRAHLSSCVAHRAHLSSCVAHSAHPLSPCGPPRRSVEPLRPAALIR